MNIKEQKTELNKTDIYKNVRKDINRRQTVHSNKSANYRSGTPEMPDRRKKVYSSYDHYYHNDSNTARMPTHNHHLYLKRLLEYHNTEHDYKVLQVKQRMKEENEMLQNEMTRLREVRKITDWKITGRTSRIWNRELMNISDGWGAVMWVIDEHPNSGWEVIHKINIKI